MFTCLWRQKLWIVITICNLLQQTTIHDCRIVQTTSLKFDLFHSNQLQVVLYHVWILILIVNGGWFWWKIDAYQGKKLQKSGLTWRQVIVGWNLLVFTIFLRFTPVNVYTVPALVAPLNCASCVKTTLKKVHVNMQQKCMHVCIDLICWQNTKLLPLNESLR